MAVVANLSVKIPTFRIRVAVVVGHVIVMLPPAYRDMAFAITWRWVKSGLKVRTS